MFSRRRLPWPAIVAAVVTMQFSKASAQVVLEVDFVPAFADHEAFHCPLYISYPDHDPEHCYVVEQMGTVRRLRRDGTGEVEVFADLAEGVDFLHPKNGGHVEEGLLGFVFDPGVADNGHVFVYYSEKTGEKTVRNRRGKMVQVPIRRSVLARREIEVDGDARVLRPGRELRILEVDQPWGNHNGGTLEFGPDGMLYIALGDGGHRADRGGNGQNLGTLLGTILRLDVRAASAARPYRIPDDNPFVDTEGARGEIWAYGLRNPWRITFDRETGDLWCGDVGQDKFEEVDRIVRGGNYGWPLREGLHEFPLERDTVDDPEGLIDPVAEYGRREGLSVTGGYVYRGRAIPELVGCYVYGDFVTSRVWSVREDPDGGAPEQFELGRVRGNLASFGERADGELQVLCYTGFRGRIYDLVPAE